MNKSDATRPYPDRIPTAWSYVFICTVLRLPFCKNRKKTATEKRVSTRTARRGSWLTAVAATSWMASVMAMRWAIPTSNDIKVKIVLPFSVSLATPLSSPSLLFDLQHLLCSIISFVRASTLGTTESKTAIANTMSISSSSRQPESSAASLNSTAMEKETENATSLPSALSASVADIRLVPENGDSTLCSYSAAFINRRFHYERRVQLAFASMTIHMTLRGLFVTQGSFQKRRVHRGGGHGHLVYGMTLDDLITAFSIFGIARRRIQAECFHTIRQMRTKLHPSAPLRYSCQAFRLVVDQRDVLFGETRGLKNDPCKRGVGACAACFLWIVLLRRYVSAMVSPQFIRIICNEFYNNVLGASEDASNECSEWRAAIDIERAGLARVCNNTIGDTVEESIDSFQHNVWGMVGLDCVECDRPVKSPGDTDSLESFECTI